MARSPEPPDSALGLIHREPVGVVADIRALELPLQ